MLLWIYPIVLIFSVAAAIARSQELPSNDPPLLSGMLDSGLLLPWVASLETRATLLPISSLFLLAGFWLLARCRPRSRLIVECFSKLSLSWFLGFMLLILSLSPSIRSLWPLPTLGLVANDQAISDALSVLLAPAAWTVGIFLLWGLPPLQQGTVDAGDIWNREAHIRLNLSFRIALVFCLMQSLELLRSQAAPQLLELCVAFALAGLGLSRLVAGVQISVQRSLSYLTQGLLLPVLFALPRDLVALEALALLSLLLLTLFWFWLYTHLENPSQPKHLGWDDPELQIMDGIQRSPRALRMLLHGESLLVLIFAGIMIYHASYLTVLSAVFFIVTSQAVARDSQAFSGRGQATSH